MVKVESSTAQAGRCKQEPCQYVGDYELVCERTRRVIFRHMYGKL